MKEATSLEGSGTALVRGLVVAPGALFLALVCWVSRGGPHLLLLASAGGLGLGLTAALAWRLGGARREASASPRPAATEPSLAREVEGIGESLGTIESAMLKLGSAVSEMSWSAEQSAAQAGKLTAFSTEIAESLGSIATASEELEASIGEISRSASEAATYVDLAASAAHQNRTAMKQLEEASAEVGSVISLINAIASQTNLLALNATIEAARAGESGRGFAVVASEVKQLAGQTEKATREISAKLETIRAGTGLATGSMECIDTAVADVASRTTSIAAALHQQTQATGEINRFVVQAAARTDSIPELARSVRTASETTLGKAGESERATVDVARVAAGIRVQTRALAGLESGPVPAAVLPAVASPAPVPAAATPLVEEGGGFW